MSNGPEKNHDDLDMAFSSSVEEYARRLRQTLDQILIELEKCGNYDQLPKDSQNALLWSISGGSKEVAQCKPETIASVLEKLSKIKATLEKDESVIYKVLIGGHLQKFLDDLKPIA